MRRPVVAVLVLAIVGVAGIGAWVALDRTGEGHFCTLGAPMIEPPPGHEGAWVTAEDGGPPGPDPCDDDETPGAPADDDEQSDLPPAASSTEGPDGSAPVSEEPPEHLRLGYDCGFRNVAGEVVATTTPNRSDGTCGQPFS